MRSIQAEWNDERRLRQRETLALYEETRERGIFLLWPSEGKTDILIALSSESFQHALWFSLVLLRVYWFSKINKAPFFPSVEIWRLHKCVHVNPGNSFQRFLGLFNTTAGSLAPCNIWWGCSSAPPQYNKSVINGSERKRDPVLNHEIDQLVMSLPILDHIITLQLHLH